MRTVVSDAGRDIPGAQTAAPPVNSLQALIVGFRHVVGAVLIHRHIRWLMELTRCVAQRPQVAHEVTGCVQGGQPSTTCIGHNHRAIWQCSHPPGVEGLDARPTDAVKRISLRVEAINPALK